MCILSLDERAKADFDRAGLWMRSCCETEGGGGWSAYDSCSKLGTAPLCAHCLMMHVPYHVMSRKQFGAPLASNQLIQKKLADMTTEIALGLQASLRVGRLFDEKR